MMQVGGKNLELVQWHFHTPSEHAFDGVRKSMEVHLVHRDTLTGVLPPACCTTSAVRHSIDTFGDPACDVWLCNDGSSEDSNVHPCHLARHHA